MSFKGKKSRDHEPFSSSVKTNGGAVRGDFESIKPGSSANPNTGETSGGLRNLSKADDAPDIEKRRPEAAKTPEIAAPEIPTEEPPEKPKANTKAAKKAEKAEKDRATLSAENWPVRNGHSATYIGLFLFSIMVLFRPYEIVPGLGFLSATAFYFALVTLLLYLPSQLATEGNLTMMSTEVKAILAMTLIALVTIPIAKDPGLAWEKFDDPYIKSVVIFIVLVNVVRTKKRLMGLMWLSFGIGVYLSIAALDMYVKGEFNVEEYRVAVDVGGMFGNPNEMAMHLVMMTPLVIALGLAAKAKLWRWIFFAMAFLFVAANMVTFSRGGFLGMLAVGAVLAWKIGRRHRLNVSIASVIVGGIAIVAAPGNYGLRMLSIFIPGLDAVGSSDQRKELLERSIWVTLRNPWGIGIGNFPIVGVRNLQTHNAFTQVSSELGILGLIAYLVFIISPFRKLSAIERTHFDEGKADWFYYLAIGFQASIVGYMVSSFFASVAYNWFIYYLIAYAVAFRRIYSVENEAKTSQPCALLK